MALRLAGAVNSQDRDVDGESPRTTWTCAFVNNMPDGAFDATERQFLGLLEAGSGEGVIEVSRYALDGVPRGEHVARRIQEEYRPVQELRTVAPDLLVVTGSNPIEPRIEDEPYWDDLEQLLRWAHENVRATLLSCLAAHAALKTFDGLERVRLDTKCTGVFAQSVDAHLITRGLEPEIHLPHSRWSTVDSGELRRAGYDIVIGSDQVGWAVALRESETSSLLLIQGHPEYEPSSLLREYHRDARRYVQHEREDLPCLPFECVAPEDWGRLEELHHAITHDRRDPELIAEYPFDEVGERAPWTWHLMAQRLYANWLAGVSTRSE
ncbi:MAG: homoserine O-succinyltransferase [Acidimicrobiales bacterium]